VTGQSRWGAVGTRVYLRGVGAVTAIGAAILVLASASAVAVLGGKLSDDWRTFPLILDGAWLAIVAVALMAAAGGLLAMMRLPSHRLLVGLLLAGGLRVAAVWLIETPLFGDYQSYHNLAVRISQGGDHWSNVPTGYSIVLAIPYALFGPQPVLGELLNVGFGVATAWLVYRLAHQMFGEPAGAAALFLFAIAPDQVLMTSVLATEPLYTFLVTVAAAMLFMPRLAAAAVAGLALGASQYVRTTTMLIAPAFFAVIPLLTRWRPRLLVVVVFFAIAVVPIIRHNVLAYDEWSISTSRRGAWSLLVGTNQQYSGAYNQKDVGDPSIHQWSAEAARIAQAKAIQRITSDPVGFGGLAVRKFYSLWAGGDYAVWIAVPGGSQATRSGLSLISQAIWAAILVLATATAWRVRRHPVVVLTLAVVTILVLVHTFVEVSPRYHASVVPLLCVLAGVTAARWRSRGDAVEPV
jgi:4-amino-4-deoxy-L-arabinose transferase-like glycosyltransferase